MNFAAHKCLLISCSNTTTNVKYCSKRCAAIDINAKQPKRTTSLSRVDPEVLANAVAQSRSVLEVCETLGVAGTSSRYRDLRALVQERGIDVSHLTGQRWKQGRKKPIEERQKTLIALLERTTDKRACKWNRLVEVGLKEHKCERCGLAEWFSLPIPLQCDHVDGDPTNNRLENLQLLCPNCHAQTPTWGTKTRQT